MIPVIGLAFALATQATEPPPPPAPVTERSPGPNSAPGGDSAPRSAARKRVAGRTDAPAAPQAARKGAEEDRPSQLARNVLLRTYDRNGDGRISPDELPRNLVRAFAKTDANGDGFLDAEEILNSRSKIGSQARRYEGVRRQQGDLVEKRDDDDNGFRDKVLAFGIGMLERMDLNQDGLVDKFELHTALHQPRLLLGDAFGGGIPVPGRGGQAGPPTPNPSAEGSEPAPAEPSVRDPNQPPPPSVPVESPGTNGLPAVPAPNGVAANRPDPSASRPSKPAIGPDGLPTAEATLKALDRNGNGKVDRDEAVDGLASNFKMLDKNKDGGLDLAELERSMRLARMFGIKPKVDLNKYRDQTPPGSNPEKAPAP
jgi:Ca2+-binding EF-hand superfamily protein